METSRWRGGGGEDGGDGARWKEDGGVVRRGQVVAAGARAKGDASRRSGVSPVSSSPNVINCSVQSTFVGFLSGQFGVKGRSCSEEMCHRYSKVSHFVGGFISKLGLDASNPCFPTKLSTVKR